MPFTLAHAAAALPFRRTRLVFSAVVVGTFAPDFEYFLRLRPESRFGHTLAGVFLLTLPLALLVLWLFHAFVKASLVELLPDAIQRRLTSHVNEFHFGGTTKFALIVTSILLGVATHLAWDSFTHPNTWLYRRWQILGQPIHVPIIGLIPLYKLLQHGSTVAGIGILTIWLALLYRGSRPSSRELRNAASPARKMTIAAVVTTVALAGAITRALAVAGVPRDHSSARRFAGSLIVTAIALAWWQLVAYGVFSSWAAPPQDGASV